MKKGILAAAAAAALMATAPAAEASSFTFNFCPGNASCNADLTEASLTFQTVDGTADVNDYTLRVRFIGSLATVFIDSIDFSGGIEFAAMPVLTSAPSGTALGDWTTKYDKVTNSAANCAGEISNHLFACSKSTIGNGPDFAGINDFVYSINFLGDSVITSQSGVNLRALFVNSSGDKVGAIFSPEGHVVSTTTGGGTTTGTETTGRVPEPAMLSLLGAALALGARRLRSRQ